MKIKIIKEIEVEACLIDVDAHVRYPEDISFEQNDNWCYCNADNPECPCIDGHQWRPIININTGKIINWDAPIKCHVFAKVCDEFKCKIKGLNGEDIINYEGYVPSFMAIEDSGYGDYIDMIVEEDGIIKNWYFCQDHIDELINNNL